MALLEAKEPVAALPDQTALLELELELTRGRIRFAMAAREERAAGRTELSSWPPEFARVEDLIATRIQESLALGLELPLVWLRSRLALTPPELRVIWVLLAHELCAVSRSMLRQLNTENCADPTTDTVRLVAFGPGSHPDASRLLSSTSPLVRGGLIVRTDSDANAPDHRKTWKVAGRIVALAQGDLSLDPDLHRFAEIVSPGSTTLGIDGQGIETDPECLPMLLAALRSGQLGGRTVIVQGQRGTGRRSLLRLAADACGLELIEVDVERLSSNEATARAQLVALARECRLFRRIPLVRDLDSLVIATSPADELAPAKLGWHKLDAMIEALDGLLVLATTSRVVPGNRLRKPQIVEPRPITGIQRTRLWGRALPTISHEDADLLSTMYPIAPALIDAAASVAREQGVLSSTRSLRQHVRTGLRAVLDGRLAGLATRVETRATWDALVLPKDQRDSIEELLARMRRRRTVYETWELASYLGRGLGLSALFSGPPGTGKTMAAGLIAQELSSDLYQVDMSKIVSKWLGETEKNLSALFEAAEAGHAILLFDEADALFGKRTDVRSSNDRHANQETNYLLQRLESFTGVCVMTTNNDTAIDEAFRRRISFHVHFPMPELQERIQLWRTMLRPTIPVEGTLDLRALAAQYEMSGGHIRNAVLRAAFFAADEGGPLTNKHLSRAAALEYQAMGRIMPSPA